jgi:hypothetical protein
MVWTNGSCASNSGIEANYCGSEVDRLNLRQAALLRDRDEIAKVP